MLIRKSSLVAVSLFALFAAAAPASADPPAAHPGDGAALSVNKTAYRTHGATTATQAGDRVVVKGVGASAVTLDFSEQVPPARANATVTGVVLSINEDKADQKHAWSFWAPGMGPLSIVADQQAMRITPALGGDGQYAVRVLDGARVVRSIPPQSGGFDIAGAEGFPATGHADMKLELMVDRKQTAGKVEVKRTVRVSHGTKIIEITATQAGDQKDLDASSDLRKVSIHAIGVPEFGIAKPTVTIH